MTSSPWLSIDDASAPEPDGAADLVSALAELEVSLYVSLDGAVERARELEHRARAEGQFDTEMRAELVRSDALSRLGQLEEARRMQEHMLAGARLSGHQLLECRSQCLLASTFSRLALWTESQEAVSECVRLLDPSFPAHWQVEHYLMLATYATFDNEQAGFELFEECLRRARELDEPTMLLVALNNFVWNAKSVEKQRARAYELAEELTHLTGLRPDLVAVPILDTLAVVHLEQGRLDEAEQWLSRALGHSNRVEPDEFAALNAHLASIRRQEGRLDEARVLLERARASAIVAKTPEIAIEALRELAEIDAETGDHRRAFRRLRRCFEEREADRRGESHKRAALIQGIYGTELERDRRRLYQELALRDPLTDVYNRRYLDERLPRLVAEGLVSVAMIDIDHFKQINDLHSHDIGDEVLRQLADLLRRHIRALAPEGLVVRLGGEEFLSIAPGVSSEVAAAAFERLRERVAVHVWSGIPETVRPTISVGLVTSADQAASATEILSHADELLYRAKRAGRNRLLRGVFRAPRAAA